MKMARTHEFMKKNEARILMYLLNVDSAFRNGAEASKKLKIDYVYVMKLLDGMYAKGWIMTHVYNQVIYFGTTARAPITEARKRLTLGKEQWRLKG